MLTDDDRERLIRGAIQAKEHAYAPYSHFRVGAALLCVDGSIVGGANIENASYGGTICAERTAIVKAVSEGKTQFVALAVTTDVPSPISPCGICRQAIREFCALDMPIFLVPSDYPQSKGDAENPVEDGGILSVTLDVLLPYSFGPEDLEVPRPGAA
ncbi:cytidine deaminase [Phlebopus sp. FC_14]|nr:cytidine deaminase [Phlebopus sp. FC_14]